MSLLENFKFAHGAHIIFLDNYYSLSPASPYQSIPTAPPPGWHITWHLVKAHCPVRERVKEACQGPQAGQISRTPSQAPTHPLGWHLHRVLPRSRQSHPTPRQILGDTGRHWATRTRTELAGLVGRHRRQELVGQQGAGGAHGGRDPVPIPLPRELGAPRGPGRRCRNRCLGVSPGLNDSELRPTGNLELSLRRCPPARVSSRRQRELWARRMGAGEGDPARGPGMEGVRAAQGRAGQSGGASREEKLRGRGALGEGGWRQVAGP